MVLIYNYTLKLQIMKRIIILFAIIATLGFVSCSEDTTTYLTAAQPLFEADKLEAERDETISFTDKSVPTDGTKIVSWAWDFGVDEASVSTEQNPKYTYLTVGIFKVSLLVTDSQGRTARASQEVVINIPYGEIAHADFSTEGVDLFSNVPVKFIDESVASDGADVVAWSWDFGVDDASISTEQNPTYTYTKVGRYTVSLTVKDSKDQESTLKKDVEIVVPSNEAAIVWTADLHGNVANGVSPAMSPDGATVYMWSDGVSVDGSSNNVVLKAYNVTTGAVNWTLDVNAMYQTFHPSTQIRAIYASPSVGENGDIYLAARDLGSARETFLLAVTAEGNHKWHYSFGGGVNINWITPAIDAAGFIYVGHTSTEPFFISKVDPVTGVGTQISTGEARIVGGLAVDRSGGIYFDEHANAINKFTSSGPAWKYDSGGTYSESLGAITIDKAGVVYTIGGSLVSAINVDGSKKWEFTLPSAANYGGLVVGEGNIVYVSGGQAIAGNDASGGIFALNQTTGEQLWHFPTLENVTNCTPLVDNRQFVHFVTDGGTYYVLNTLGTVSGIVKLSDASTSSPVMNANGEVVIVAQNADAKSYVYGIETEATAPANSDWPMKGQNHRRSSLQKE